MDSRLTSERKGCGNVATGGASPKNMRVKKESEPRRLLPPERQVPDANLYDGSPDTALAPRDATLVDL